MCYNIRKGGDIMGAKYNEAQKKATIKYLSEKTDDIRIRVPKGKKEEIRAYAENKGYSLNSFINEAIDDKMQKPE